MRWQNRIPDGVGDVEPNNDGFTAKPSLPTDEDEFFGRACPACADPFKMHVAEYKALPEETELHCPCCGHRDEHSEFLTVAQRERAMEALHGLAEQYVHDLIGEIFRPGVRRSQPAGIAQLDASRRDELHPGHPAADPRVARDRRGADPASDHLLVVLEPPRRL